MKCENCLHCEMCTFARQYRGVNKCPDFYDKDLCVKLPCKVGTKVYAIATPFGGCKYNNLSIEETLKSCRDCQKREIIECEFDYDLLHEFGETVFPTRAEAEKKLEGMPQ
mgnify:FL=1